MICTKPNILRKITEYQETLWIRIGIKIGPVTTYQTAFDTQGNNIYPKNRILYCEYSKC